MNCRVTVRLFGGIDVSVGGSPVAFPSRKASALFAYLSLHRTKLHSRTRLADLFWEGTDERSARRNLSTALWRVRTAIRQASGVRIHASGDAIALICEDDAIEVDVETFSTLVAQGHDPGHDRLSLLRRAEALYKGDLLEGHDSSWCEDARRYYSALYSDLLRQLSDQLFDQGEYISCAERMERLLERDPLSDEVNTKLMIVYHLTGRRSAALALYERFRVLLQSELGLQPSEAMAELRTRLQNQGDWIATAACSAERGTQDDVQTAKVQLVGREAELGRLVSLLNRSTEATAFCVVKGDGGVGKTRLAEALGEEAALRGYQVLQGRCPNLQSPPPYQVFVQALWPRIEHHLNAKGPLTGIVERLASAVSPQSRQSNVQGTPQISGSAIVLEILSRLLTEAPTSKGTLLILEDVHWVDRASEALLASLVDRVPKAHLVVIATFRDDTPSATKLLGRLAPSATVVELQPLGRADTDRLASALMDTPSIPVELGDFLWSTSGGVPLFAIELIKYLADKGYLARGVDGSITLDSKRLDNDKLRLPTRIVEVLRSRIEALDASSRTTLASAAVLGAEVGFSELEAMLGKPMDQLSEDIERLLERRLLTENNATLRFPHDIIRTVVLSTIGRRRLRELHRCAGELLESTKGSQPEELAWHFKESGDAEKAARYNEMSGDIARALHANADALRRYTLALGQLSRQGERDPERARWNATLLLKRQDVLDLLGDRHGQARDIRQIFRVAGELKDSSLRAHAQFHNSRLLCRENANREALRAAHRAARLYREVGDQHGEANSLESTGLVYVNLRDLRSARSAFRRALVLFRRARDSAGEARVLVSLGTLIALDGKNADALKHLDEAEHVLRLLDDKRTLAGALIQKGVLKRSLGELKAAERQLITGISIMKEVGDRIGEARGLSQLANTHVAMGKVREAMHEARHALMTAVVAGDTRALIVFLNNAAYGPFRCVGDFERAARCIGKAIRLVGESGGGENLANYYDTMAALLLDKGEARQALTWALRSQACFRAWKGRFRFLGAHIHFRLGICYLEVGEFKAALGYLRRAAAAWEKEEELGLRILALSAIGRLHASEARFAEGIACAREVEGLLREVDGVEFLQNVHWNQYITFRAVGLNAAARRSLRRAYLALIQQSHGLKGRYRRRFLHGVKINGEILDEFGRVSDREQVYAKLHLRSTVPVHPLSILGALDDVGERRRVVSEYVRAGELTQREIALRLDVSERTVRSDLSSIKRQESLAAGLTQHASRLRGRVRVKDSPGVYESLQ